MSLQEILSETESDYINQAKLEFTVQYMMALNLTYSSLLSITDAGIVGINHHTQLFGTRLS